MSGLWLASYIALWAVVLLQGGVIFMLLRQLGIIYLGTAQGVARDGLAAGQRAPEFTLPDLDGRAVSLAGLRGLPLLLVFGSPACGPCRTLMADLNAFADERRGQLRVLFLSRGELEEARRFGRETEARVPIAVHPDDDLPEKYRARVTPFGFLLDGEGVVRAKGLTNNREHLDLLLRMGGEEAARNGASAVEEPALEGEER